MTTQPPLQQINSRALCIIRIFVLKGLCDSQILLLILLENDLKLYNQVLNLNKRYIDCSK